MRLPRSHLILPLFQKPNTMDAVRADFANVLIDQLAKNPTTEMMDRIETVLWGKTFGPESRASTESGTKNARTDGTDVKERS